MDVFLCRPFGAMIRPFVDAMSVNPEGGHALFDSSGNTALTQTESASETASVRPDAAVKLPAAVTYSDTSVISYFPCCVVLIRNGFLFLFSFSFLF